MEKLEPSKREAIKKLSTVRLISKLLGIGMTEEKVQAMDRSEMLNVWAEMVAAGKDEPIAYVNPVTYDPELERQRLEFEMKKFEQESEHKRREIQLKELELDERRKREDATAKREDEDREERRRRYEEEMRLKERELQIMIDRDRVSKTLVSKTKAYADALKGTMARMPIEVIHLLSYFKDVEQLFANFEVPGELRAQLLRPYLNEKAKILVSRMDPAKTSDYNAVKEMLFREFKLSPAVYLEKFNTDTRKQDETCLLYSARLVAILDAYLDSRNTNRSYDKITQLLVCDKIKSTLPEGCLKHILAIESNHEDGWLKTHELAEAVDLYFANRWQQEDRPRAGALGIPTSARSTSALGIGNRSSQYPMHKIPGSPIGNRKTIMRNPTVATEISRRCFICGSKFHFKSDCPERNKANPIRSNAKVNTCQVHAQNKGGVTHNTLTETSTQFVRAVDAEVQVCVEPEDITVHERPIQTVDVNNVINDCQPSYNEYAKLQYIDVKISDEYNSNVKVMSCLLYTSPSPRD